MRRPKSFGVGEVRVRAVKGPRDGEWYWRAEVYSAGSSSSVWAGWGTRKEATQIVAEIVAAGGVDVDVTPSSVDTVFDLLDVWIGSVDARADLAPATVGNYRNSAARLAQVMSQTLIERVGAGDLEDYRDRRLREGAAPSSVALDLRVFLVAWHWGERVGVCPPRHLRAPRMSITRVMNDYTPTPSEAARVLEHLSGWTSLVVLMLATTGCRVGELAGLRWEQLNLQRGEVTVTGKGKTRTIPLRPEVVQALQERPGPQMGRVFPVVPSTVANATRKRLVIACAAAGVPHFTPHGLRRMVENTLAEAGIDPATYAALLGHSPLVALKHYRRVRPQHLRAAIAVQGLALPSSAPGTIDPVPFRTRKP